MNKSFLHIILLSLCFSGCSRFFLQQENIRSEDWVERSFERISRFNPGWDLLGGSGSSANEGGAYIYDLRLKGASETAAKAELINMLVKQLEKDGFTIYGRGQAGEDFSSIRVSSSHLRATITIAFSKPSATGIPVSVAIAQVARHE